MLALVLVTVALWIGALDKLYQLVLAPDDRPLRAVAGCLACLAVVPVLNLPPVVAFLDGFGGGVARLLVNLMTMAASYWMLAFFQYSVRASRRLQTVAFAGALGLVVGVWLAAPAPIRLQPAALSSGGDWHSTVFVVAAVGYMAYALGLALRWAVRYARVARRVELRRGLRAIAVGLAFLIAGCVCKCFVALLQALAAVVWEAGNLAYVGFVLVGSVLLVAGVMYPAVTGMLAAVPVWRWHRRAYREMEPLWRALHEAFPDLALRSETLPWWRDPLRIRRTHRDYYRRAVEIRDGLVQLGPYYPADDGEDVPAAEPGRSSEADHAQAVRAALAAKASGAPAESPHPAPVAGGDDLDSDVRWLVRLSRSLA
jgi:hypothetical protein